MKTKNIKLIFLVGMLLISIFISGVLAAPLPPTSVSGWVLPFPLEDGRRRIRLTWEESEGATEYRIYKDASFIGSTGSASYAVSNLNSDTWYEFQVSAYSAAGESSPSPTESIRIYIPRARLRWEEYTE